MKPDFAWGLLRQSGEKAGVGVIDLDSRQLITEKRRDWREISVNEACLCERITETVGRKGGSWRNRV